MSSLAYANPEGYRNLMDKSTSFIIQALKDIESLIDNSNRTNTIVAKNVECDYSGSIEHEQFLMENFISDDSHIKRSIFKRSGNGAFFVFSFINLRRI